jgi:hypothetical protein
MNSRRWMSAAAAVLIAGLAALAPAVSSATSSLQTQTALFADIDDAVPNMYFNAETTAPDPANPERLVIGFNSGINSQTWVNQAFVASTEAFYRRTAMDTLSFTIQAPAGQYISRVTYRQSGTGSVARTGSTAGGTHWVVDGEAASLGTFATNPTLTGTIDLTGQNKTSVPVSITTALFAWSPPLVGSATVKLSAAEVQVELQPLQP